MFSSITNAKVLTLLVQRLSKESKEIRSHNEGAELLKWKVKVIQCKLPSRDYY